MPSFSEIAMHDAWKSYDVYTDCRHVLCNTHLLRDLQGIIDSTGQSWAQPMQEFLTQALMLKKQYKVSGTFRSKKGAESFCQIRSFISIMKKQKQSVLQAMSQVIETGTVPWNNITS